MLIDEIITNRRRLAEAQFRQPRLMYHGTSSAFLPSILKQGMVPEPKRKNWDTDEQQAEGSFSRKSLFGSYWTSNYMTASSSATNTMRKFPGDEIIIIAQIAEQSAYADEDNINSALKWAVNDLVSATHPQIRSTFWLAIANEVFGDKRALMQRLFAEKLHAHLSGSPKHPVDRRLTDEVLDTLILRNMAFEQRSGLRLTDWVSNPPELPSISEIEDRLLRLRDRITRSYRSTAFHSNQFNHTLRLPTVVGFSGANRIRWILRFQKWHWEDVDGTSTLVVDPATLIYGKLPLPEEFLKDYRARVGEFPGLVDPAGHLLMPSERKPRS